MSNISTTKFGEEARKRDQRFFQVAQKSTMTIRGTIDEVEPNGRNLVKVMLKGGTVTDWMPLNNGALEIAQKVGRLRGGNELGVKVTYTGEGVQNAFAELSLNAGEKPIGLLIDNDISKDGLYGIFQ